MDYFLFRQTQMINRIVIMQKSFSNDTKVFSASNQVIIDDAFMMEMNLKANKLRAKAFAQLLNFVACSVVSLFASTVKWFNSKIQKSRVMNQLYSMDDRALADIGLTRGDIEGVINGTWMSTSHKTFQPIEKKSQVISNNIVSNKVLVEDGTRIAA
jgi:uncharacterized protein YjiS (DUF1127 family)